jgi:hypothetical protein
MTTPRDAETLLSAYLADGMEVLPDRVVVSVLDEIHRTRQRAGFRSWRTRSTYATAFGAAATIAVIVVGGAFYFGQRGQPGVGGPSPTPVASSGASQGALVVPGATPSVSPSPTPPVDVNALVSSTYDRYTKLPPLAMTWLTDGTTKSRIYVDRSGAVRVEYFAAANATTPRTWKILNGQSLDMLARVGSGGIWVVENGAIGEDPRVYILAETERGISGVNCADSFGPTDAAGGNAGFGPTPSESPAAAWIYVGLEAVAGRPTHHVACGVDLWIDVETGLILKTRSPVEDNAGRPFSGRFRTTEVTEIDFADQPSALFDLTPPQGIASISREKWGPHACTPDLICSALPSGSDSTVP